VFPNGKVFIAPNRTYLVHEASAVSLERFMAGKNHIEMIHWAERLYQMLNERQPYFFPLPLAQVCRQVLCSILIDQVLNGAY
jgi:hypothetical protein